MSTIPKSEIVVPVPPMSVPEKKRRGPKPRRTNEERITALKAMFASTPAKRGPKLGSKNNPMGRKRKSLVHLDWKTAPCPATGKATATSEQKEYWNKLLAEDKLSVSQGEHPKLVYSEKDADKLVEILTSYAVNAGGAAGQPQLLTPRREEDGSIAKRCSSESLASLESVDSPDMRERDGVDWMRDAARANEFDRDPDSPFGKKSSTVGSSLVDDDGRLLHWMTKMFCRECRKLQDIVDYENVVEKTRKRCTDKVRKVYVERIVQVTCDPVLECGHVRRGEVLTAGKSLKTPIKGAVRRVAKPSQADPTRGVGVRLGSAESQHRAA